MAAVAPGVDLVCHCSLTQQCGFVRLALTAAVELSGDGDSASTCVFS